MFIWLFININKNDMRKSWTTEKFIERAIKIHGDKYDYSKVEYKGSHTKVCIICPKHGEFWQTSTNHLKWGCSKCSENYNYTTQEWEEKARKVHDNRYDYSKVEYINNHTKICIICSEHGEFYQTPLSHTQGKGCPHCKMSRIEKQTMEILLKQKITFKHNSRPFVWLKDKSKLQLDFYLPDYNIAIECQGEQHFYPISYFGGKKEFEKLTYRDRIKRELCAKNNLPLYYINYNDNVEEKLVTIIKSIFIRK